VARLTTSRGEPTGAVLFVMNMLLKLLNGLISRGALA